MNKQDTRPIMSTDIVVSDLLQIFPKVDGFPVNARDLHGFLGSRREFATWIKDKIDKNGFDEGVDFCLTNFCQAKVGEVITR